jgi:hypothetical protein
MKEEKNKTKNISNFKDKLRDFYDFLFLVSTEK